MRNLKPFFSDKHALRDLVDAYFKHIEGEYHLEKVPSKKPSQTDSIEEKVYNRDSEVATITGLALFLGFNSRDEFDEYENSGKYAPIVKRARLRVEAAYEKLLHRPSPTGAIFVLKSMGWNEKVEKTTAADSIRSIKVKIIESGPQPAFSEKEVVI
ncbi:terminase small subunit [Mucilaginibacter sp.]|uniref:terminase small subunit n=1 Tax=Mucilaginibacter sp. TaxID=1882438 RepID=UPI002603FB01|nr:terminase small subunit [Mucilaginibacter sp.]MDB5030527.1 hypothetical protein [Mucilaginibacter sp.]